MVLVVIDYSTRKVEVVGIIEQAHGDWMKQMAKNLTDPFCGFLKDKKYLIHDRDPLYAPKGAGNFAEHLPRHVKRRCDPGRTRCIVP